MPAFLKIRLPLVVMVRLKQISLTIIKIISLMLMCLLYLNATAQESTMPMMDHSHLPISVPASAPTPQLSLAIYPDVMGGYNLSLSTQNYHLIPPPNKKMKMEDLMMAAIDAGSGYVEGHAHLYVNGVKIQRAYGYDLYLPASLFNPGVNQLTISLNNHGHMYWTSNNKQILASLFFKDDKLPSIIYKFESFPVDLD